MAASVQEAIRRLRIETTTSGVTEATNQLKSLASAQDGVAVASERVERATLSEERRFDSIERKYVAQVRARQDYEKIQRQINDAVSQNPALQDRANVVLEEAKRRHDDLVAASSRAKAANDNFSGSVGLARYELINLSRQAQDVAVSLAGGQSPFTVLMQQGSQIGDIFTSSQGTVGGFFKQVGAWAASFLSVGRLAFGGVAAAVTATAFALSNYLDKQRDVALSLTGSGRASGSTVAGINDIAAQASSWTGLSVSEARSMASALAATGKVANDNILPIVKMGHDIATAFGVDAAEATKLLAQAFSDPAKGAEALNARLGFLDAATQQNIKSLMDQNRLYEAQRVLSAGVQSGLQGVSDQVATTTKFWTALGNSISNAWDKFGQFLSNTTGIGLTKGLQDQLAEAQAMVDKLSKREVSVYGLFDIKVPATKEDLENLRLAQERVDQLTEAMRRNAGQTQAARDAQLSFAQSSAVRAQLPEIDQLQTLRDQQELLVRTMVAVQTTGGESSPILTKMGRSYEELAQALGVATAKLQSFKNEFTTSMDALKLQNEALSAFSPGAQAEIARRQSLQSTLKSDYTDPQRQMLAQQAYENSIKQSTIALSEQQRARELSAQQAVDAARLEICKPGQRIPALKPKPVSDDQEERRAA